MRLNNYKDLKRHLIDEHNEGWRIPRQTKSKINYQKKLYNYQERSRNNSYQEKIITMLNIHQFQPQTGMMPFTILQVTTGLGLRGFQKMYEGGGVKSTPLPPSPHSLVPIHPTPLPQSEDIPGNITRIFSSEDESLIPQIDGNLSVVSDGQSNGQTEQVSGGQMSFQPIYNERQHTSTAVSPLQPIGQHVISNSSNSQEEKYCSKNEKRKYSCTSSK